MPEKQHITRLARTTGKGHFYKSQTPKYKYIQDPSEFVDNNYKDDYSQYKIYYESMSLNLSPIWGPFSGERLSFKYDWDTVEVWFSGQNKPSDVMVLKPGTSPEEFMRFCLVVIHKGSIDRNPVDGELWSLKQRNSQPAPLTILCLRSAVVWIKHMRRSSVECLPMEFRDHFCNESQINVQLNLWPADFKNYSSTSLIARSGMVISEFVWLVRHVLGLASNTRLNLYRHFMSLKDRDVIGKDDVIDCVLTLKSIVQAKRRNNIFMLTKLGPRNYEISRKEMVVVSVSGIEIKEMPMNLSLPFRYLDIAIRRAFRLKPWSFLTVYLPVQEKSFFQTSKAIESSTDVELARDLVANQKRNFPVTDKGMTTAPIKQLYNDMSIYGKSLRSLGFHSGCYIEVFEITGPTVPVMLFGDVIETHAIDVNPAWTIELFLYYIRMCVGHVAEFNNIDYIRSNRNKTVQDILQMMGQLWTKTVMDKASRGRLEYLRVRK